MDSYGNLCNVYDPKRIGNTRLEQLDYEECQIDGSSNPEESAFETFVDYRAQLICMSPNAERRSQHQIMLVAKNEMQDDRIENGFGNQQKRQVASEIIMTRDTGDMAGESESSDKNSENI